MPQARRRKTLPAPSKFQRLRSNRGRAKPLVAALVLFSPIPRPERFLVALSRRPGRAALRADALERISSQLANLAPFLSAERTEPSVSCRRVSGVMLTAPNLAPKIANWSDARFRKSRRRRALDRLRRRLAYRRATDRLETKIRAEFNDKMRGPGVKPSNFDLSELLSRMIRLLPEPQQEVVQLTLRGGDRHSWLFTRVAEGEKMAS
jgi:hypothetical protein